MSKGNYSYAELKVRFRFNRMMNLFTFDTHQYHLENHFIDSYEVVNEAKDRSLVSSFGSLIGANMTAYYDW